LAVDARVDAGLTKARNRYELASKACAMVLALAIASATALIIDCDDFYLLGKAVLVGLAAVPLAPIANDLASAIQKFAQSLRKAG
jgi:hypothetical protein